MATTILDQFGRPAVRGRLYPAPSSHPYDSRPRPQVKPKIYENVLPRDRWEQVQYSSVIASRVTNIEDALTKKAEFAVGDAWHVRYRGSNKPWGKRMMAFINETYYRTCNYLGEAHDFHSTLKQLSFALDVQADYGAVFDNETGTAQFLSYDRIGSGDDWGANVGSNLTKCATLGVSTLQSGWGSILQDYIINDPKSWADGARIIDGVIVDQNLRRLGYRVLGYDEDGNQTYADIPANSMHFNYDATRWLNQVRGIPALASLIDDSNTVDDANYYWGQAIKLAAAMAIGRESKDGRPASGAIQETEITEDGLDGTTRKFRVGVEQRTAGIVELSTDNEEALKVLDFNRPSLNEAEFIKRLETSFLAKHWPRALIYPEDLARAGARAIAQQVRQIVWARQRAIERTARWWVDRAISWAMRTGRIPENAATFDPYNYEFTLPGEFTIDEGNDGKMYLAFLGRGCITRGIICNKQGYQLDEIQEANEADEDNLAQRAERLHERHNWLTPREWLLRLNNPFNNPPQPEPVDTALAMAEVAPPAAPTGGAK